MKEKAPSKTAALAAERAERKRIKAEAKAKAAAQLADLKARAQVLCSRLPASYSDWGVTKTRAYSAVMAIVKHKAGLKTIKPEKLAVFVHELENSDRCSLGQCQQLSTLKPSARELTFFT